MQDLAMVDYFAAAISDTVKVTPGLYDPQSFRLVISKTDRDILIKSAAALRKRYWRNTISAAAGLQGGLSAYTSLTSLVDTLTPEDLSEGLYNASRFELEPRNPGSNATEAAGGVDTGLVHGPPLGRPNFIASSNGEIVAVPDGAVGPTMAGSGNGIQFTGGSGGRGLDPRVTDIRVMDPVTTGKYTYPDGYVSYSNAAGQTVSPVTGQTIGKSDPFWHWQWGPK